MSQHYFFHEPGSVPGIPGLFSSVRVDVADDGTYTVSPLPYHPYAELTPVEDVQEIPVSEPTPIRKKKALVEEGV